MNADQQRQWELPEAEFEPGMYDVTVTASRLLTIVILPGETLADAVRRTVNADPEGFMERAVIECDDEAEVL